MVVAVSVGNSEVHVVALYNWVQQLSIGYAATLMINLNPTSCFLSPEICFDSTIRKVGT